MKKQLLCTLTMLAFLASGVAKATHNHEHHPNPPDEKMSTLLSFTIMTVVSAAIHKGGDAAKVGGATKGLLHVANVLYNVGQIADKQILRDWSVRTLLIGASAVTASSAKVQKELVPFIPMIGQGLVEAGVQGTGVVTVALYNLLGYAYEALRDRTPVGHFLRLNEKDL